MTNKLANFLVVFGMFLIVLAGILSFFYRSGYAILPFWLPFVSGIVLFIVGVILHKEPQPKVVILDNNELSIASYMEEYPDMAKEIMEEEDEKIKEETY